MLRSVVRVFWKLAETSADTLAKIQAFASTPTVMLPPQENVSVSFDVHVPVFQFGVSFTYL